jgi:putative peptidoglycan lipid II flippase
VALIGVALGTIAGVDAARLVARKQSRALAIRIGRNLRNALFISLPAAVGLAMLADPLIRVLLQRGQFTAADTTETVEVLKIFCLSIPFACLCPALIRTSMAMGLRTLLMPASVAALLVNWTLLTSMEGRWGVPGLAAASVISTMTSWIIFEVGIRKHLALPRPRIAAVFRNLCVVVAVALETSIVLQLSQQVPGPTWVVDLLTLTAGVSLGIGITIVVGRATGAPEVRALQKLLRSVVRVFHRS